MFLYWRTPAAQLPGALHAVQVLQGRWRNQHPGLVTGLYQRQDDSPTHRTLMETYALAQGIPAGLQRDIVQASADELAPWCDGQRHLEVFVPVEGPRRPDR